ncbi:hypothetical protein D3C72_1231420 [compost metagenome]
MYGHITLSVMQSIADQVGKHLAQAFAVPHARHIAHAIAIDLAVGKARLRFIHRAAHQRIHALLGRRQRQAARLADARHVQQVFDQPRHALTALQHALGQAGHARRVVLPLQQGRAHDDGLQRRTQVMA